MKLRIAAAVLLGSIALVQADETIARAQQALKDQGFYYGEVTGEKNAEMTAAIRRFQIRNGLQITGELNSDTMRSLVATPSATPQPAPQIASTPRPEPPQDNESEAEDEVESDAGPRAPLQPFGDAPQQRRLYPSNPSTIVPPAGGLFAGTPYDSAPPEVQRDVVASTQRILERRDLYRGDIDGVFGPGTEFSLRAYQARVGLRVTGRLDLETLAALELLPGERKRLFTPRWRMMRPRPGPAVRGEWVRP